MKRDEEQEGWEPVLCLGRCFDSCVATSSVPHAQFASVHRCAYSFTLHFRFGSFCQKTKESAALSSVSKACMQLLLKRYCCVRSFYDFSFNTDFYFYLKEKKTAAICVCAKGKHTTASFCKLMTAHRVRYMRRSPCP